MLRTANYSVKRVARTFGCFDKIQRIHFVFFQPTRCCGFEWYGEQHWKISSFVRRSFAKDFLTFYNWGLDAHVLRLPAVAPREPGPKFVAKHWFVLLCPPANPWQDRYLFSFARYVLCYHAHWPIRAWVFASYKRQLVSHRPSVSQTSQTLHLQS